MQYIVTMRSKREILFDFWLPEKLQKTLKLIFLIRGGKKEKLKSDKGLVKTNDE